MQTICIQLKSNHHHAPAQAFFWHSVLQGGNPSCQPTGSITALQADISNSNSYHQVQCVILFYVRCKKYCCRLPLGNENSLDMFTFISSCICVFVSLPMQHLRYISTHEARNSRAYRSWGTGGSIPPENM